MSDEPKKKPEKKTEPSRNIVLDKLAEFRAEFRKIVWPSREDMIKHTVTVIVISLLFGAYIALTDGVFGLLFTSFVGLVS